MALRIPPEDPNLAWQGAISFQGTDAWMLPWRIP